MKERNLPNTGYCMFLFSAHCCFKIFLDIFLIFGFFVCSCNKDNVTATNYTVTGLDKEKPTFRVLAVNEAGTSRPSNTVGPIECKDDLGMTTLQTLYTLKTKQVIYMPCTLQYSLLSILSNSRSLKWAQSLISLLSTKENLNLKSLGNWKIKN